MKSKLRNSVLAALFVVTSACGDFGVGPDPAAYEAEILDWRERRIEALLQPSGYLTQVGLDWIEDGR